MNIGVPKEIKDDEFRVGLTPPYVGILTRAGHTVLVQKTAGEGSGITDKEYFEAGAILLDTGSEVFARAEMIVKVKEPMPKEYEQMQDGQIIFTYLHLAPNSGLTQAMLDRRCIGLAYETVQMDDGSLPLLRPMSEVAGRLAPQIGANLLRKSCGGRGILLGGVSGVERGKVTIIGGGIAGTNAAKVAVGLMAEVCVIDVNSHRLAHLDDIFGNTITTLMSNPEIVARHVKDSDLVIGAVLIPVSVAPALVTREMISAMAPGSVVVDVAIDQGGCFETNKPTTHQDPTFLVDDVIHYCPKYSIRDSKNFDLCVSECNHSPYFGHC